MRKPNFFIIGAPKCGTTSLARWLREHPKIYMSPWKEPRYFDRDLRTRFRIKEREYFALFKRATDEHLAVGEATVWYLYSQEAVPNIEREIPGARYIVMIRNPVEMAYSLHEQMVVHQVEHVYDFAKAWELSPVRRAGHGVSRWVAEPRLLDYQSVCMLGTQLERLFAIVPKERVLVLVLDDIKENPRREYLRVLAFLGVPDDNRTEFPVLNRAKRVRWRGFQRALLLALKAERVVRGKVGLPPQNSKVLWRLNDLNKKPRPRPPMPDELRARLEKFYSEEIRKLERVLERDFSNWFTTVKRDVAG